MHIQTLFNRVCPYRFHPAARTVRHLGFGLALALILFAVVAEWYATVFPDYLLVFRYVEAAKETAPTMIAVGIVSGVWLDLAVRQYGKPS